MNFVLRGRRRGSQAPPLNTALVGAPKAHPFSSSFWKKGFIAILRSPPLSLSSLALMAEPPSQSPAQTPPQAAQQQQQGPGESARDDMMACVAALEAALLPCLPARELQAVDRSLQSSHQSTSDSLRLTPPLPLSPPSAASLPRRSCASPGQDLARLVWFDSPARQVFAVLPTRWGLGSPSCSSKMWRS
jgi:hypothetical protein